MKDWKVVPVSVMRGRKQFLSYLINLHKDACIVYVFLYATDNRAVSYFAEGIAFVGLSGERCSIVVRRFDNEIGGKFGEKKLPHFIAYTCSKSDLLSLFGKPTTRGGFAHGTILTHVKRLAANGSRSVVEHTDFENTLDSMGLSKKVKNRIISSQKPMQIRLRKRYNPWKDPNQPTLPFVF